MAHYRLYFMNEDGSIASGINLDCKREADLDKAVEERANWRPMEVWQGDRRVRSYPATDPVSRRAAASRSNGPPTR
jgi:hypothetical protein